MKRKSVADLSFGNGLFPLYCPKEHTFMYSLHHLVSLYVWMYTIDVPRIGRLSSFYLFFYIFLGTIIGSTNQKAVQSQMV